MTTRELIDELGSSELYTLHTHTQFCDGRSTMAEIVDEGIRHGFTHIGFTPHSPVPIESPCNMSREDVDDYFREMERLRPAAASHGLKLLAGMEVDWLSAEWGAHSRYIQNLPLDYRISSVHFIPSQEGRLIDVDGSPESFRKKLSRYFRDDLRYVVETFFRQSHDSLSAGGFEIIGHFDKIARNGSAVDPDLEEQTWYADLVHGLIDHIAEAGVIVEINTKAAGPSRRFFPHRRWWRRLLDLRNPLIVNSDAHESSLLNAGRPEALAIYRTLKKD